MIKKPKIKIFIPYNHQQLFTNGDFIFQTIIELRKQKYEVHILLRQHCLSPLTFLKRRTLEQKTLMELNSFYNTKYFSSLRLHFSMEYIPLFLRQRFGRLEQLEQLLNFTYSTFLILLTRSSVIWSFDHQNYDLFKSLFLKNIVKLYDCVDYYSSNDKNTHRLIKFQENIQMTAANVIFANSRVLFDICKRINANTHLVPQGFDLDTFSVTKYISSHSIQKILHYLKQDKRKKITYIGNLNYRIDYDLLINIITKNSEHLFLLSATSLDTQLEDKRHVFSTKLKKIQSFRNVFFLPHLKRADVKKILKLSDVGIIPYQIKFDFNRYCFPMKFLEYLYMGLPVISTPIEELKSYYPYALLSKNGDEWNKLLRKTLLHQELSSIRKKRRAIAVSHSWEDKVQNIMRVLKTQFFSSN